MERALIEVKDLKVQFKLRRRAVTALEGVSFSIAEREVLGIVGETGCGNSVTALSILRLIPSPEEIIGGEILFAGEDPLKKSEKAIEKIRGREISMVFQEPMTSFNPSYTIGEQISECLRVHLGHTRKVAWDWAEHILVAVRMPAPRAATTRYPHELSGRMR